MNLIATLCFFLLCSLVMTFLCTRAKEAQQENDAAHDNKFYNADDDSDEMLFMH
jgi:preprotein translocase subunit SecG